jgi:ferric-dicitrate binding protein FerR (iron transport regulator)
MNAELLARYLSRECTTQEYIEVESWLRISEEHVEQLKSYERIWVDAQQLNKLDIEFDSALDWSVLQNRIEAEDLSVEEQTPMLITTRATALNRNISYFSRIAAILSLVFLIGFYGSQFFVQVPTEQNEAVLKEISMKKGQRGSVTLSDGTLVSLNSESSITLPDRFKSDVREVYLNGEAFFEVAKNEEKPFKIYVNGTVIEVLGTSFAVRAFPDDESVRTTVVEGLVSFRSQDEDISEGVLLSAGDLGEFNLKRKKISKEFIENLDPYISWKEGYLTFEQASMTEVRKQLERKYDIEVVFEDSNIELLELTAELKSRSLRNVLETISLSLGLEFELDQEIVRFKNIGE